MHENVVFIFVNQMALYFDIYLSSFIVYLFLVQSDNVAIFGF